MTQPETKRALVLGLGVTGLSCVRHLAAHGYDVAVADTRAAPPGLATLRAEFPGVPLHVGPFTASLPAGYALLVVSPGVPLREPAIARALAAGAEVVGDIELFVRAADAPVLAITGSNGKSTVTALVGAMCRAGGLDVRVGGNIGVPALELLGSTEPDVYVLELSSFQLETTHSLNARAATVLNITPDHMDRYASLADYEHAKARIYGGDGVMVLNADDPRVLGMAARGRRVVRFGLSAPASPTDYGIATHNGAAWLTHGAAPIMPAADIPIAGTHNRANVLAACALADQVSVPRAAQVRAVHAFTGLPHRTEIVAARDGITWINDSKGTNVGATVAALHGMSAPTVLIAGGDGKGADFSDLAQACRTHARAVVLIGRDAPPIEAALAGTVPVRHAGDMIEAVRAARTLARSGDVVLLSPACASFDMYRNYEHRGEVFRAAVEEMLR